MRKFWAQPLRTQLFIAILLLLVPVLAAAVWSGVATYRERSEDLRDQSRTIATTTAALVNRDLDAIDRMAEAFTGVDWVVRLAPPPTSVLLERAVRARPAVVDIVLAAADGTVAVRAGAGPALDLPPAWVADTLRQQRRIIVPLVRASGSPQVVLMSYPLQNHAGEFVGAIGCVVSLKMLQDALTALPLPPGSVVTIADESSRVLARSVDADKYVGRMAHPGRPAPATPGQGVEQVGVDGVQRIYSVSRAGSGPWVVTAGIPVSVATNRAVSLWSRSFTVLGLGLVGWLIVAFVLSRRLGSSVNHLHSTARRIAAGDFSPMDHRPMLSREFADLQMAFDAMLHRFNATRGALDAQMSEERRIREELQSLQGQVIRQERLAAVGQLVSGVAHEINNPLQAILGFAELLQMQSDVPEDVKADLRLIQKESARACGIIRNLALFARQQPGQAAPVRLTDVITSVAELRQRRLASEDIELRIEDKASQRVMAVLTELQQVVLNYVVNAEQAVVGSGRLPGRITLRSYDKDSRVILEVEDTGPGIPLENEAKLFQPFFTTKPVGQGTGLGLSISYGIIDSMGGRIGYRAAPAGGAIFYFDLPAVPVLVA
jgi:C4-dicarboxylate-specific signal transduction histidine kinase